MGAFQVLRYVVFAIVAASALVALASWAVRTRQVNPFSYFGRTLRNLSEPFVSRVERWVVRRGGNPQNAGWWIFGGALVGGIVVISLVNWFAMQTYRVQSAGSSGRGTLRLVVSYTGQLIQLALIARVIGTWFGVHRYNRWMRPAYLLTDWIVVPIQKILPPMGMIDFSPLIAWFVLRLLFGWLVTAI